MESVAARHGEARECLFVAVLRAYHEFGIHASSARGAPDQYRRAQSVWARRGLS
jgi:hypothetical protein